MRVILIPIVALGLLAGACSTGGASGAGNPASIRVVAAFFPVQQAAEEVGGPLLDVTNLTAPGVEPHDLELTPDQVVDISTADVVFYLGSGFQPAVQDAIGDAQGETVDLLKGMPTVRPPAGSEEGLAADPHVWLDPVLYQRMVGEVVAGLVRADPPDAETFRSNGEAFEARVAGLDRAYRAGLATCRRRVIVTNHAAFGYLASRYGLTQQSISGLSPDAEPNARRLAELRTLVERDGVTTIFTEDAVSPEVAQTLAQEAGVQTAVLHTLEALTPEEVAAGDDYVSLMRENLTTLERALDCS
jgi:zinc transport system substrate-binding protein